MEKNFFNDMGSASHTETLSGFCPNCGCPLKYSKTDTSVKCESCDSLIKISNIKSSLYSDQSYANTKFGSENATESLISPAQLIDSPDSGLIYLENKFANMDWSLYGETANLIIPEIEEMVEKNKIKHGASASAWLLDFESVTVPLTKKIEKLRDMANDMADRYSEIDNTAILEAFDFYKEITEKICDSKENIIKRLENDISYAEKLSLDETSLAKMREDLENLRFKLNLINLIEEPTDIPEVSDAQKRIDDIKTKEFADKGVVVKDIYDRACALSEDPKEDINEVLQMFEGIRGYADVNSRIEKINRYYHFNEYFNFCGKNFIFKTKKRISVFDPRLNQKPKKRKRKEAYNPEDEYSGTVIALFEVINGKPAKEPLIENITQIITVYGNRLYYVKLDSSICYFDLVTKRVYEFDSARIGDYIFDKIYFNRTNTAFFVRKKLPLEINKAGCIKKLFGKKDEVIERNNNYSILKVSLISDYANTVVPQLVDVTEHYGDNIFYTVADEKKATQKNQTREKVKKNTKKDKKEEEKIKLTFKVYNVETRKDQKILDDECQVHTVVDNKVIYSRFAPNAYNLDLYVYDIDKNTESVIENNILDFFTVIKDRIFYTVGNDSYCPLFSKKFDGSDRVEIMQNVENIVAIRAGWMYVIKGNTRNAVLIKVSSDGKQRKFICSQFKQSIKITDTYIYYLDTSNSLRVVRTDGKDNILIADHISASSVIVDKDCIYYLRKEFVDTKKIDSSLYRMDLDGHNVSKLIFDVAEIDNYDDETIVIERNEKALFEVTIPIDKKNNTRTENRVYNLKHFCKYNKKSGNIETVLGLGYPDDKEHEFAKGCFGKTVKYRSTFKRLPMKKTFTRKDVAKAGAILDSQAAEAGVNIAKPNNKKGCSPTSK